MRTRWGIFWATTEEIRVLGGSWICQNRFGKDGRMVLRCARIFGKCASSKEVNFWPKILKVRRWLENA